MGCPVVPHEGTWIEMSRAVSPSATFPSFPTRERGLKLKLPSQLFKRAIVVPHEGTWIEILPFFMPFTRL